MHETTRARGTGRTGYTLKSAAALALFTIPVQDKKI